MTFWTISWQIKCSQKHIWVRCIYQFQSFRCSWTLSDWCIDHGLPQHQIEEGLFSTIQLEESRGRRGGKRFQHLSLFSACISSAFPHKFDPSSEGCFSILKAAKTSYHFKQILKYKGEPSPNSKTLRSSVLTILQHVTEFRYLRWIQISNMASFILFFNL